MPTIRVDDEVYAYLQGKGLAFVDSPNDVLRRELEIPSAVNGERAAPKLIKRLPRGICTPRIAFEKPILLALRDFGGRAPVGDVLDRIGIEMQGSFTQQDLEELPTGGLRWHKNANFARLNLVKTSYLAADSPRGMWELTVKGQRETSSK